MGSPFCRLCSKCAPLPQNALDVNCLQNSLEQIAQYTPDPKIVTLIDNVSDRLERIADPSWLEWGQRLLPVLSARVDSERRSREAATAERERVFEEEQKALVARLTRNEINLAQYQAMAQALGESAGSLDVDMTDDERPVGQVPLSQSSPNAGASTSDDAGLASRRGRRAPGKAAPRAAPIVVKQEKVDDSTRPFKIPEGSKEVSRCWWVISVERRF